MERIQQYFTGNNTSAIDPDTAECLWCTDVRVDVQFVCLFEAEERPIVGAHFHRRTTPESQSIDDHAVWCYKLNICSQEGDESISEYFAAFRKLAERCKYSMEVISRKCYRIGSSVE